MPLIDYKTSNESPIRIGIKTVGIGKKGSQSLGADLAQAILSELKLETVPMATVGAFFGGLLNKGVTQDEMLLQEYFEPGIFENPEKMAQVLCHQAPARIIEICTHLLKNNEMDEHSAYELGQFLFSELPGDGARGLAASILRVRYETPGEYAGLLKSMHDTLQPCFRQSTPMGDPVIQVSEPFDGVDHNYLLTPCVTDALQKENFRVVSLVGRNSGPKAGNNLFDLAKSLDLTFLKTPQDLKNPKPRGGWFIDQKDMSRALDRWVNLRHQIIKRPFLATLEKFLNPCQAQIVISSAFHGVYGEKMTDIAKRAGFSGSIVVRNGIEGSIAFPLTRPAKILCAARQNDGSYLEHEIIFDSLLFLKSSRSVEEKLNDPSLEINASLIRQYFEKVTSENSEFNDRIASTLEGLKQAIQWIQSNRGDNT